MKVKVRETMEALGVDLAWFEAEMDITYHGSFGDNRTTPEEPAHYEMNSVQQINGPFIPPDMPVGRGEPRTIAARALEVGSLTPQRHVSASLDGDAVRIGLVIETDDAGWCDTIAITRDEARQLAAALARLAEGQL